MGFFSEVDLEIMDMVKDGANFHQIKASFPMLRDDEIDQYLEGQHDGEESDGQWDMSDDEDDASDAQWFMGDEDDGQPTMYEEYQDYMGGDNWDYGQCDEGGF